SIRIERIRAHAFAYRIDLHVIRNDLADVTVLAVPAAYLVSRRDHCRPYRRSGSLRNRLQLEERFPLCRELRIQPIDLFLKLAQVNMPTQLGMYPSWVHRRGTNPPPAVTFVKRNREQDVRCLRSAIRDKRFVGRVFETRILEIY